MLKYVKRIRYEKKDTAKKGEETSLLRRRTINKLHKEPRKKERRTMEKEHRLCAMDTA